MRVLEIKYNVTNFYYKHVALRADIVAMIKSQSVVDNFHHIFLVDYNQILPFRSSDSSDDVSVVQA